MFLTFGALRIEQLSRSPNKFPARPGNLDRICGRSRKKLPVEVAAVASRVRPDTLQLFSCLFSLRSGPASENQVIPMSSSSEFLISREDELALHMRLVDGDV